MMRWRLDITAFNRAGALTRIHRAGLPRLAALHFKALVQGENYIHTGVRNPDGPLRVRGAGEDHGVYISFDYATVQEV